MHCTGEIPEIYHTSALFDFTKMGSLMIPVSCSLVELLPGGTKSLDFCKITGAPEERCEISNDLVT